MQKRTGILGADRGFMPMAIESFRLDDDDADDDDGGPDSLDNCSALDGMLEAGLRLTHDAVR